MSTTYPLGIDVGGTGIKGAPVDLEKGAFAKDRVRIDTPKPSTPDAVADVIEQIADKFAEDTHGQPIGITLPCVVTHGIVRPAANIDTSWIGTNVEEMLSKRLGRPVTVVNDADAAGVGELHFGAARNTQGTVLVSTLGTGIGSALLVDGELLPNSELGHLEIDGYDAESKAAESAHVEEDLSWEEWAQRLQRYYSHI